MLGQRRIDGGPTLNKKSFKVHVYRVGSNELCFSEINDRSYYVGQSALDFYVRDDT